VGIEEIERALEIPVVAKMPDENFHVRALFGKMPAALYKRNSKFSREINRLGAALCGEKEKKSFIGKLFNFNMGREEVNRQLLKKSFYIRGFN
jgi:MinD-like ATPase involved in chromosome partitioning or flagellar assembly